MQGKRGLQPGVREPVRQCHSLQSQRERGLGPGSSDRTGVETIHSPCV